MNVGGETRVAQKLTPRPAGELRPSYAVALKLVNTGTIKGLVTQTGLSGRVKGAVLNITRLQKLAIDDVAMRQVLMFYSVPKFSSKASKQAAHYLSSFGILIPVHMAINAVSLALDFKVAMNLLIKFWII